MKWWQCLTCTRPTCSAGSLKVQMLTHWNNSSWVDISLHSDTLFWFWANQTLFLLLNAACLAEKQQLQIVIPYQFYSLWLKPTIDHIFMERGFIIGLWCLTLLSTIFQLYRGSQFYWWRKSEYPKKTTTYCKSLTNFIT